LINSGDSKDYESYDVDEISESPMGSSKLVPGFEEDGEHDDKGI
jgi:hypothetical protein